MVLKPRGYYPTFEQAIVAVLKFGTRKIIASEQLELKECVDQVKQLQHELMFAVKQQGVITKKVKTDD